MGSWHTLDRGRHCGKNMRLGGRLVRRGEGMRIWIFLYIASLQQDDLRLSSPPRGQGADGGARTPDRRAPADLRADSIATVPPTPLRG
ncbi:hypothetical protein PoB_000965600 [Plakobranchus ocellatus]|uniref:Uncharacterized protein n=1 Tax=Plakobranchus ocellatus TaxID=259542 RepID=A0AAV3Y7A5_9GAST|nr:hypothetical protein PoB_000965600 [Plakobranchus ocellatus]